MRHVYILWSQVLLCDAGNSVAHHLMGSYQRSLLAIMLAQFTRKRFAGGMAGVVRLASRNVTVQVGLSSNALRPLDQAFDRVIAAWGLPLCLQSCFESQDSGRSKCKQSVRRYLCLQGLSPCHHIKRGLSLQVEGCALLLVRYEVLFACAGAVDGGSWSGCACAAAAQQVGLCPTIMHAACSENTWYHLCVPASSSCRSP